MFTCIRCLSDTDNDCDICDACISEARETEKKMDLEAKLTKRQADDSLMQCRIEELKGQLTEAVEALEALMDCEVVMTSDALKYRRASHRARTTLASLKGKDQGEEG